MRAKNKAKAGHLIDKPPGVGNGMKTVGAEGPKHLLRAILKPTPSTKKKMKFENQSKIIKLDVFGLKRMIFELLGSMRF